MADMITRPPCISYNFMCLCYAEIYNTHLVAFECLILLDFRTITKCNNLYGTVILLKLAWHLWHYAMPNMYGFTALHIGSWLWHKQCNMAQYGIVLDTV
jgi:hypothetical protein